MADFFNSNMPDPFDPKTHERPLEKGEDRFARRPVVIFQASSTRTGIWFSLAALAFGALLLTIGGAVYMAKQHQTANAYICAILAAIFAAVLVVGISTPPVSVGLNVETRKFQMVKGAGKFKKRMFGTFDEIVGVATEPIDTSRGVMGFSVTIRFAGDKLGKCVAEEHEQKVDATARTAELAKILGVANIDKTAPPAKV